MSPTYCRTVLLYSKTKMNVTDLKLMIPDFPIALSQVIIINSPEFFDILNGVLHFLHGK